MPTEHAQNPSVLHRGNEVKMDEQKYYRWFRRIQSNHKLFNLTQVSNLCDVSQSSLYSAVQANREFFQHADKLKKLYDAVQMIKEDEEF